MEKKTPKNTEKYYWTQHVVGKMQYYGLSEQKVLGVIKKPFRTETGIAPSTVAVMQPVGNIRKPDPTKISAWQKKGGNDGDEKNTWSQEIWVMYQLRQDVGAISKSQIPISKHNEKIIEKIKKTDAEKAKKLKGLQSKKLYIISAWRFPGVSPKNNPIPDHVWREIEELL